MALFGIIKKVMTMYFQHIQDLREDRGNTRQEFAACLNLHPTSMDGHA